MIQKKSVNAKSIIFQFLSNGIVENVCICFMLHSVIVCKESCTIYSWLNLFTETCRKYKEKLYLIVSLYRHFFKINWKKSTHKLSRFKGYKEWAIFCPGSESTMASIKCPRSILDRHSLRRFFNMILLGPRRWEYVSTVLSAERFNFLSLTHLFRTLIYHQFILTHNCVFAVLATCSCNFKLKSEGDITLLCGTACYTFRC